MAGQIWNLMNPSQEEKDLILIGLETLQICQYGFYKKNSRHISLSNSQKDAFEKAIIYSPDTLEELQICDKWKKARYQSRKCRVSVINSDSFEAASGYDGALVMNFANARRPGGGFLYGAKAQEESLCRASTLYASISSNAAEEMYRFNQQNDSPVDSDYMILSPEVCVFRNHNGDLLDVPFHVSVITVPAPDKICRANCVPQEELDRVIRGRMRNMFMVASYHGYRSLILGAWGCGVFGNDARDIAGCFYDVLVTENYMQYFDDIIFAILQDQSKLFAFQETFDFVR